ncbi:MAG: acyl carrier protein [Pseudomonas sp.]|uniref:acyl carrier protein n=1 Tax=Pseudomonas abieticivorans TaxID=2931382 RepID=UPI0020BEE13F|nr:acyl carrier protein [Pseudomonas sp. PIA16]MDE1164096.1 acyl carrier protein [Pseudomonas sp.]
MNVAHSVRAAIARQVGFDNFDDRATLQSLGLDREDILELIFRLQDQFELTARTRDEDQLADHALTVEDVCRFIEQLAKR